MPKFCVNSSEPYCKACNPSNTPNTLQKEKISVFKKRIQFLLKDSVHFLSKNKKSSCALVCHGHIMKYLMYSVKPIDKIKFPNLSVLKVELNEDATILSTAIVFSGNKKVDDNFREKCEYKHDSYLIPTKVIYLIRHGESVNNILSQSLNLPRFTYNQISLKKDCLDSFFGGQDTLLSLKGEKQSVEYRKTIQKIMMEKNVDICLVSPLRRAIATAYLIFFDYDAKIHLRLSPWAFEYRNSISDVHLDFTQTLKFLEKYSKRVKKEDTRIVFKSSC
tara:strand:- start:465 stop:1292 length:828 start_codon:yes stop_codon:yes gene_type:complete